ncbi:MAG TPA: hydantoinase/oxoprolinase family protein, partial [Thermoleophilaceae bacterium]|nr:hydantoinase/oxoprolinase family protein [Thermoleophilaceae bacterium]
MLLGVDVGGTFTDAALLDGDRLVTAKAPTTPDDQSRGVIDAVRAALRETDADAGAVTRFVHGMTVGTNALLEGRTAKTALLATEGFVDLEELRRQNRAELYRLCASHAAPIVPRELRVAVPERTGPDGVLRELDEHALRERLAALPDDCESAAVCLLWSFLHPEHEQRVAALVDDLRPGLHVSTSHETAPVFREYERCATTVVDAAISPLLRTYLRELTRRALDEGLPAPEVMLSSGGVAGAEQAAAHGSWTVLSGPAGGAVGAAWIARAADAHEAVCLDMGGTSCDVSVALEGGAVIAGEHQVGGRPLALPMVDVHTVGAGGGSVAWLDAGGALRVGPRSAGAVPGPACYGRGGNEATVTDANLVLGYLDAASPLAGGVDLDRGAAERVVHELGERAGLSLEETAAGIVRVASAEMARAVRVVTVERGIDPRGLALVPFGGAGPLHAAAIADELGMDRIVVPQASGVLSALGLLVSERRRDLAESVLLTGDALTREAVADAVERLADRGRADLAMAPKGSDPFEIRAAYDLRYAGQAFELTVHGSRSPEPAALRQAFNTVHLDHYGYFDEDAELELVTVRVAVAEPGAEPALADP